jgi:ABC-type dipeptide/oligopeptide/nickel transport system permease component
MLEVLNYDFVRTARAKGLFEFLVINKHAFRNALIPVVTEVGISIVGLIEGSTVIEVVFAWPGIARMAYQAALYRDFPMLQGCVLIVAALFVVVNLAVDALYYYLDPELNSRAAMKVEALLDVAMPKPRAKAVGAPMAGSFHVTAWACLARRSACSSR